MGSGQLERLARLGALEQLARQADLAIGGHHGRLELIPNRDLEDAVFIFQFGAGDDGLAFALHVHEHAVRVDLHDATLDHLAVAEGRPGLLVGEQRGEVFFLRGLILLVAHCSSPFSRANQRV